MSLSLQTSIDVQMKIMHGLVSGMPIRDLLTLVIDGMCIRFTDYCAGIWMIRWHDGTRIFTLEASHRLPREIDYPEELNLHIEQNETLHDRLEEIEVRLQLRLQEYGFASSYFAFIPATNGDLVGVAGIFFTKPTSLSPQDVQVIDRYAQVAGLAMQKEQADEENHLLAYYDFLTSVPNRRLFHRQFDQAIRNAITNNEFFSLVLLDLDNFKIINDTYGHLAGDKVLQVIAKRIMEGLRKKDTLARLGGDEFALLLCHTSGQEALRMMQDIMQVLVRPITLKETTITMLASAGIVACPEHGTEEDDLLRRADQSLYAAKTSPHAKVILFTPKRSKENPLSSYEHLP